MPPIPPRQLTAAILIALLFIGLTTLGASTQSPGELRVSFIDVGQGDSALLQDANGFDVLIDGGTISAGTAVVAYLHQMGIDNIDVLVASHADSDHIGGLLAVLEATDIPVEAVVLNGYSGTSTVWTGFLAAVASRGLTPTLAQFPQSFLWGEMSVQVLNPASGLADPDTNAASLVLLIDHGEISFLFTGDIESAVEEDLLALGTPLAADVLKVAHHGSNTSSSAAFLQAVSPHESIISVGSQNTYGHPSAVTLNRLGAAGSHIWRTDRSGSILVISDGSSLSVIPQIATFQSFLPVVVRMLSSTVTPTPITPQISIQAIFFDGAGSFEPDEYVELENNGSVPVNLQSWTLADKAGHTFTFPLLTMQANQVCRVYTNQDHPESCGLNYHSNSSIWNNSGDCAYLKNASALLVSSFCY
jgi:competence protein ComEC